MTFERFEKGLLINIMFIILFCLILYNLLKASPIIENYEARLTTSDKDECANHCRNIINCSSFGYDNQTNKCYLSKIPILGQPLKSLYSDEYQKEHYRCNKKKSIDVITDNMSMDKYRDNNAFICAETERSKYNMNYLIDNKLVELENDSKLFEQEVKPYDMFEIEWPTRKVDVNIFVDKVDDSNLNYKVFEKKDNEYLGKYMFPHKCVSDVSLKECLRFCDESNACVGVEFNPTYLKENKEDGTHEISRNVCCPKISIDEAVPRRAEFIGGSFYLKNYKNEINKNNHFVIIN